MRACIVLLLLAAPTFGTADETTENPVRKVVNMLQLMQKKIEAEAKKQTELFDKYMCWCEQGKGALAKSIGDSNVALPQIASDIEETTAKVAELTAEIKQAKVDRQEAKDTIEKATGIREKEAAEFAAEKDEKETNIAAIKGAVAALEKGMAGAFLQTSNVDRVRNLVSQDMNMVDGDKETVMSFLSGGSNYAPAGGEITGILKQMGDEMEAGLAESTAAEEKSISDFEALIKSKKALIATLTKTIERKLNEQAESKVAIAQMKAQLGDTQTALEEDKKFLEDMDKNCAEKKAEWAIVEKTRAEEKLAISETIKILNDDDALELFKSTLGFVQIKAETNVQAKALEMVRRVPGAELIVLALQGKSKGGFEKIITMIDNLVVDLKNDQKVDDDKIDICEADLDAAEDSHKELSGEIADTNTAIEENEENQKATAEAIKVLEKEIKDLDKAVAEATEQRKDDHAEFEESVNSGAIAEKLLAFAKNRLNKFYNPKLYKAPPKKVLSAEEKNTLAMGGTLAPEAAAGGIAGTGIGLVQADPGPAPEGFGEYKGAGEAGNGVIAMIDQLIAEINEDLTTAKAQEKADQKNYEAFMADSSETRADKVKSKDEATTKAASLEEQHVALKEALAAASTKLKGVENLQTSLHADCDWIMKYHAVRQEARSSEIDSLNNAKAVLSGADYALVQRHLRR